jgi:hypothetical protein
MRPPPLQRRFPKTFPSDQCLEPSLVALRGLALPENGAGNGNRTHKGSASGAENKRFSAMANPKCD